MADSNLSAYKEVIAEIAKTTNPNEWEKADWSKAVALIDQSVLEDAHNESKSLRIPLNMNIDVGPMKDIRRVYEKRNINGFPTFKIICDFMRVRVVVQVSNFELIIGKLREVATLFYLRGGGEFGSYATRGTGESLFYRDIAQFAYAFLPTSGHFIEIQILEPIAAHTFHIDSVLRSLERNDPNRPVDVWTNGLYEKLRMCVLAMDNGEDISTSLVREMQDLCDSIYKENKIPHQIRAVLLQAKHYARR